MLNEVLKSCQFVHENSRFVKINYSKLKEISFTLNNSNSTHWLENNPFGILDLDITGLSFNRLFLLG